MLLIAYFPLVNCSRASRASATLCTCVSQSRDSIDIHNTPPSQQCSGGAHSQLFVSRLLRPIIIKSIYGKNINRCVATISTLSCPAHKTTFSFHTFSGTIAAYHTMGLSVQTEYVFKSDTGDKMGGCICY